MTQGETLAKYVGAFVDALWDAGVEDVCLCPGSRSTPLALMIMRHERIKVWTHLDERSCAFFALGMAKANRRPVAILCSSGTAAVNFAPAVFEAFNAGVSLIVLTADRPQELRDVGATQTIDQVHLYGRSVKWSAEMLLPDAAPESLRYVRMAAGRAVAVSSDGHPGPVHLNFPFREPLVPDRLPAAARAVEGRATLGFPSLPRPSSRVVSVIARHFFSQHRGVIVCGPQDDPALAQEVTSVAQLIHYPVLADVLSQVRCGEHHNATVLGAYDNFLRDRPTVDALRPEFILRFGATPVSKPLSGYLQRYRDVPQILVSPDLTWRDPDQSAETVITADATSLCSALRAEVTKRLERTMELEGDREPWLAAWQQAERSTVSHLSTAFAGEASVSEGGAFWQLERVLPDKAIVFAGNSMPVRDLDTFFGSSTRPASFLANRGASGIDGVVSSALGAAVKSQERVVLAIGDVSFYHDMNGLLAARRYNPNLTIVLINNDGGGIFSFLPQYDDQDDFEALFGTPHGLDFAPAAELYGLPFERVSTPAEYETALRASFDRPGVSIIELRTIRTENLEAHRSLWRDVATALNAPTDVDHTPGSVTPLAAQ